MTRSIAMLLGLVLFASAHVVLARSGGHGGSGHSSGGGRSGGGGHSSGGGHSVGGGQHSGGHFAGGQHFVGHPGRFVGRPIFRPGPVFIGGPHFRRPILTGGGVVLAAPFFYPYPYYPPAYAAPVYTEPPAYIEQGAGIQYYCPDYQDYYPSVASCPSAWVQVAPDGSAYPQ